MNTNDLQADIAKLVTPRALSAYAEGLGWSKVDGVIGLISAYRSPLSNSRQIIIPNDATLDDYAERASEAVNRLAAFEGRSPQDILNHVVLPPSDMIRFREISPEAEAGDVTLEHGMRVLEGAKRSLLATAHSVAVPQAYHPRLSREDAKQFLSRCRMSTARGSFVLTLACQLDSTVAIPGMEAIPFTRRVTSLFTDTLIALDRSVQTGKADDLLDPVKSPGMSANFCEGLSMMRPDGDRSTLTVSAAWSRSLLPNAKNPNLQIVLRQELFGVAEELAPRLRSVPQPKSGWFFGYVKELCGQSTVEESRPAGEVRFILFDQEQESQARADLSVNDHAKAVDAYRLSKPVQFKGILHRLPRMNRIEVVEQFDILGVGENNTRR